MKTREIKDGFLAKGGSGNGRGWRTAYEFMSNEEKKKMNGEVVTYKLSDLKKGDK